MTVLNLVQGMVVEINAAGLPRPMRIELGGESKPGMLVQALKPEMTIRTANGAVLWHEAPFGSPSQVDTAKVWVALLLFGLLFILLARAL